MTAVAVPQLHRADELRLRAGLADFQRSRRPASTRLREFDTVRSIDVDPFEARRVPNDAAATHPQVDASDFPAEIGLAAQRHPHAGPACGSRRQPGRPGAQHRLLLALDVAAGAPVEQQRKNARNDTGRRRQIAQKNYIHYRLPETRGDETTAFRRREAEA